jgi:hypothetical protein
MMHVLRTVCAALLLIGVAACETNSQRFPAFEFTGRVTPPDPPVIRQPVLPEMLVACRGHVFVPALGMTFVGRGQEAPDDGQYLREERLTAPYRVLPPGARVTMDKSPARLNLELDEHGRIIGLYCG